MHCELKGAVCAALLAGSSMLVQGAPARAQSEAAGAGDGEIIITAQRREESLQKVPVAVTAFSGDRLNELGLQDSVDLGDFTPNLQINEIAGPGSQPAIFLRGIGLNDFSLNNSGPVALYTDEVNLSAFGAQNFAMLDLNRVEVLRGPQGTLYGRNTTGGAVNFVSNLPGDSFEGHAIASYGSYNAVRGEFVASGPLSDTVGVRVAALRNYVEGYFKNVLTGQRSNGADAWALRGTLRFQPNERLDMILRGRFDRSTNRFTWYDQFGMFDPASVLAGTPALCADAQILAGQCVDAFGYSDQDPKYRGRFSSNARLKNEAYGTSLRMALDLDAAQIISVTGYNESENFFPEDTDVSPNRFVEVSLGAKSKTFSQELRASGETGFMNWIVGAFYSWERITQDQTADVLRDARPSPDAFFSRHLNRQSGKTYAAFGQVEAKIADPLTLVAGLRYTHDQKDFRTRLQFEETGLIIPLFDTPLSFKDSNWSWKLGLNYEPSTDWLLYGSVSRGYKGGGFNGGFIFNPAQNVPFETEELTSYEVGAKGRLFDDRMTLNMAGFYYDYRDIQVFSQFDSNGFPVTLLVNAPKAELYGAELELSARLGGGFSFNTAVGLLHSEFKDFPSDFGDFSGNRLARAPSVTASGGIRYEGDISPSARLQANIDVSHRSFVYYNTENTAPGREPAYTLVNGRIGVTFDERYSVALWGRNLFDTYYAVNRNPLSDFGFVQVIPGEPRSIGIELGVTF